MFNLHSFLHSFHQLEQFDAVMAERCKLVTSSVLIAIIILFSVISSTTIGLGNNANILFIQSDGGSSNDGSGNNSSTNQGVGQNITNWTAYSPVWSVGDTWTYSATLDAQELVERENNLQGAVLDFLLGTATLVIQGVEEVDVAGEITPVYRTVTSAVVVGNGYDFPVPNPLNDGSLLSIDGVLTASYVNTEYLRVGDLALVKYDKHLVMEVTAEILGIGQTVEVANYIESGIHAPPLEYYDFPMSENESWNLVTNLTKTYTKIGTTDLISIDIPTEPEYYDQEWKFLINATGDVDFPGCEDSTLVWMLDEEDEAEEWRWWCPSVNQYAIRWTDDIALSGVNASLVLNSYQPANQVMSISIDLSNNSTPLNSEIDSWVNITDSNGQPVVNKSGFVYLRGIQRLSFVTDENGSAQLRIMVGNSMDNTPTAQDWGTHGVVAYLHSDQTVGSATLTLEGSAIGGLLRLEANLLASEVSGIMSVQSNHFSESVRF
ncbi:MAG: hypothetical protein CMA77_05485 [Euryarchaeota archaeon]|nr:hypothetical protein [Euryarchaeota archaeon]